MQRREFIKSVVGSALLWKAPALLALQAPSTPPAPDPAVKRVLVMFKCHFDAGFVDTQAAVVHRYFKEYFPRAIDLASQLRQSGNERYVWTTGSWLLYEYLEQATPEERTRMEKAIAAGDIAWHALPFTWQTELMDASMISGGIGLSQALDRRFGKTTTGAKMTDVPGHTRGLIAPLAAQGVKFLDIGVNEASTRAGSSSVVSLEELRADRRWWSCITTATVAWCGCRTPTWLSRSSCATTTAARTPLEEIHQTYSTLSASFPMPRLLPRA